MLHYASAVSRRFPGLHAAAMLQHA